MHSVAVVGGGILGCLSALLLARHGLAVRLYERNERLFGGASSANEGKVHLGPTFAMADNATRQLMLTAATQFAGIVEDALETSLDWDALAGDDFTYIVMPHSLRTPEELASEYRAINDSLKPGSTYLGRGLEQIIDPQVRVDSETGLPIFTSAERAIDPRVLGERITDAVIAHPSITVLTSTAVSAVRTVDTGVEIALPDRVEQASAALNCAWDQRAVVVAGELPASNIRLKAAVRLAPWPDARTATLVQGPFGDVVAHRGHVYLSWYPVARLTNELRPSPSDHALALAASLPQNEQIALDQTAALRDLGLIPRDTAVLESIGGFIMGEGAIDIHSPRSLLHNRSGFGVRRNGRVFTPMNFKLTTAPLSARQAVDALMEAI